MTAHRARCRSVMSSDLMDHLREDRGEVLDDLGAESVGQALPDAFRSDRHVVTPHSSARATSSSSASRVSLLSASCGCRGARLVAATGSFSTMRSRLATRAWPSLRRALTEPSRKRRPKSGCRESVTSISIESRSVGLWKGASTDAVVRRGEPGMAPPFLNHRIGDPRILRLIRKWLNAGVLEDGIVSVGETGTGQGSVISPLLANIYLHYAFDLWAERWRRREARGDMIIVRYADDIVLGFEHEAEALRFQDAMQERLAEFALSLHPDKTRLIEFGRFAAERRKRRGLGKPETFTFLGFTHICGKLRSGKFVVKRKTRSDRMRTRLRAVK